MIVDTNVDEIRDLIGEVSKTDIYSDAKISLRKKVDKKKYILKDNKKDLSKSKVPDNIKVLYDGVAKLVEVKIPETGDLEKQLNYIFNNKNYNSATERKKDIRKEIYHYIFGPHDRIDSVHLLKELIDPIYEIEVKSRLNKGKKRLRTIAIKELKKENKDLYNNPRVKIDKWDVEVRPLRYLEREAKVYDEMREVTKGINHYDYDPEFLDKVREIKNFYN